MSDYKCTCEKSSNPIMITETIMRGRTVSLPLKTCNNFNCSTRYNCKYGEQNPGFDGQVYTPNLIRC